MWQGRVRGARGVAGCVWLGGVAVENGGNELVVVGRSPKGGVAGQPGEVAVCAGGDAAGVVERAGELARELGLPLAVGGGSGFELLLVVTAERLELRTVGRGGPGPVYAEFERGAVGYGRRAGGSRLLLRAVGVRGGEAPSVVDATAGLGQDAFVLAWAGCRVTAVERSPVAAALLEDGLRRALRSAELAAKLGGRLSVVVGDARTVLKGLSGEGAPEVVYLDPMYPARRKAALGRKEMSVLRRVVGDDEDAGELLDLARRVARRHVVVKRMRLAPELGPGRMRVYAGKTTRYDVYAGYGG